MLIETYDRLVTSGELRGDDAQRRAARRLEALAALLGQGAARGNGGLIDDYSASRRPRRPRACISTGRWGAARPC